MRRYRLATFALLIAACAQMGMVTHALVDEHPLGETCEICIAHERADDALIPDVASPVFAGVRTVPFAASEPTRVFFSVAATRNRGPPLL